MEKPIADQTLATQLEKALALWVELTGVDPSAKSFRISLGGGIDEFSIQRMHKAIKEALELDPTNITGHLLLDAFATAYFRERAFSIDELLSDPDRTASYVAKARVFREFTRSPEIRAVGDDFALTMRQALRHYGADTEAAQRLLEDRHRLAYLRRDALRSIENLRVDQFLRGEPEKIGVRPEYNAVVHQFWNVNSLIQAACHQPSGVTLSLVRDPSAFHSYFCFAIRNGGNLFVLSDVPVHAHPLQRYMSRRPDREFDSRTARNWFPYGLLNVKYDEESNRLYFDADAQKGLVPINQVADRLKSIADLEPEEIVWITMMFDLIVDRFWRRGFQAPELSYTGQMVREQTPLLDEATRTNLPVARYQPLALAPLTTADVRADTVSQTAIGNDGGAPYRWMEDRYAAAVPDEVVNLLGRVDETHYLPSVKAGRYRRENHERAVVSPGGIVSVGTKEFNNSTSWEREGRYELHALDAASFGSRQEIEDNRGFLARHNLAKAIERLACKEFEERKDEIIAWWTKSLTRNIDYLYRMALEPEVLRQVDRTRFHAAQVSLVGVGYRPPSYPLAKRYDAREPHNTPPPVSTTVWFHQGYRHKQGDFRCHVTGAGPTFQVVWQPQTADDLAELAGCSVDQLPDVIQHWCERVSHRGNSILDRIDPMAWAIRDPWERFGFCVRMSLSIRGLAQLQKQLEPLPEKVAVPSPKKHDDDGFF